MAETTTFAASGEEAIARQIHVEQDEAPHDLSPNDLEDFFEIERTVEKVLKHDYKRIALQFPDELLHLSVPIYRSLKAKCGTGHDFYVLADTSYGSCCVDEVAAQHVDADAMVHYGHACMSQTSRLPVIYVFGKSPVEVDDCVARLTETLQSSETAPSKILLRTDVRYAYAAETIADKLRGALPSSSSLQYHPVPRFTLPAAAEPTRISQGENAYDDEEQSDTILYLGGESLGLTNLLITHSSSTVYSYDPKAKTARLESGKTNKLLMRRYATVQRARDADVFGILVGTLGVAAYLPLITRLRALLKRRQKKAYTITVGKLNPAKLGNFLEVECFVLVACPENSLVEARDFLRPIVTPFELEIALQDEPEWTGRYVLDFGRLALEDANEKPAERGEGSDDDADRPMFSLVTGTYRQAKRYGGAQPSDAPADGEAEPSAVVLRNQDNALSVLSDSAAGHFLQGRTYRGLETRIGEDAPSVLEQGRSGIARGYQTDTRS
ncbi:diphthamide biosynthesis protein [Phanerochaete sordida]|uniref:2-(3-amino-3-carboxypropyl)histidine synthase subunit 2 n=1 Tax=Phanerochaete sordida TaxID=48140 RepID=A0A9P3GI00_9APHY|nr:diphthamide biosynthesis protein [Phanerochaete sordida]